MHQNPMMAHKKCGCHGELQDVLGRENPYFCRDFASPGTRLRMLLEVFGGGRWWAV
jgi:hypothetical protein